MSWLDIVFIVIWVVFLAMGARLGSLWMGACLAGGFLGALLADTYAPSAGEFIGHFAGAQTLAALLLFIGGLLVLLIPGYLLSRIGSMLFLGIIDSAVGFFSGALVGFVFLSLVLLVVVPLFPKVEKTRPWKESLIVKNYQDTLEEAFNRPSFQPRSMKSKVLPMAKTATKNLKQLATDIKEEIDK